MFLEMLERHQRTKRFIGFCKWKDGEGLLFGRVLAVDAKKVTFALVHPDGTDDDEVTVRMRDISRLEESTDYAHRLELYAAFDPPLGKTAGQSTSSPATIKVRLREAHESGECVGLTYRWEKTRYECRILRLEGDIVELEELGDDPLVVVDTCVVRLNQIKKLRWRSWAELAVTRVWAGAARPRRSRTKAPVRRA